MQMTEPGHAIPETELPGMNSRNSGCVESLVLGALSSWVLAVSIAALAAGWTIEQALFEGSLSIPDLRWAVILAYGGLVILPLALTSLVIKSGLVRPVIRTWMTAGVISLAFFPTRFLGLTNSAWTGLLQMTILLAAALYLRFVNRGIGEKRPSTQTDHLALSLALGYGLLIGIPWAVWGALGSILDTLFGITIGLLLGATTGMLVNPLLKDEQQTLNGSLSYRKALLLGFFSSMTALILVCGVSQNGNQWLLSLTVPAAAIIPIFLPGIWRGVYTVRLFSAAAGLAAVWVLVWIDADELSLVTASGAGELIAWSFRVALATVAATFFAIMLLAVFRKWLAARVHLPAWASILSATIGLLTISVAATWFGQPGLHGEKLFVVMEEQANLSTALAIDDHWERREFVYRELVQQAESSQTELRMMLDRFRIPYRPYYLVNALEVDGGPLIQLWLEGQPGVDRILDNPVLRPLPNTPQPAKGSALPPEGTGWNLSMIHADEAWSMGVTGSGIVIGQADSGVQGDHPELADGYRGSIKGDDYHWLDPWNGSQKPIDIGGHGTHTLGSILGNQTGVAPDAEWIGCVNLARNLGNPAYYLDCWQFLLAPYPQEGNSFDQGEPRRGAMVFNNSWGCPAVEGCDSEVFQPAAAALRAAGVFVVVSAGNAGYGGCGTVKDPPAIYDEVFSVGAVNASGQLAGFSSLGPVEVDGSMRTKPDIAAPGEGVLSAFPNSSYEVTSGTSMAGPHVAGTIALMWSANSDLIGNIEQTEKILRESAQPYTGYLPVCVGTETVPNNGSGYGLLDAFAAVNGAIDEGAR